MHTADHLTHKGWSIEQCEWTGQWRATGPDYDASTDGPEGDWIDNGERVEAPTFKAVIQEIDEFLLARAEEIADREQYRADEDDFGFGYELSLLVEA